MHLPTLEHQALHRIFSDTLAASGKTGMQRPSLPWVLSSRGGFQLSLFGYDFVADHQALTTADAERVDTAKPDESLILVKPTDADQHEGGKRMDVDSWQYRVLRHWIAAGAQPTANSMH